MMKTSKKVKLQGLKLKELINLFLFMIGGSV